MATLRHLMSDLAQDPTLVEEIQTDPRGVLARYELSDEAQSALVRRDPDELRRLLADKDEGFGFSVTVHVKDPTIKLTVSLVKHTPVVVVLLTEEPPSE